jgi:hypothetical protein
VDQSFSSSNSTEISMRRFYAQNFITIGLALQALSCERPAGRTAILTDSRVYSLFEYTKNHWHTHSPSFCIEAPPMILFSRRRISSKGAWVRVRRDEVFSSRSRSRSNWTKPVPVPFKPVFC